jgi:PhoPQ-activated pathogenicity-related protein
VQKPSIDKLGDRKAAWVKEYDPGSLLPRCHVPIFFVNGSNDAHYVLDSYMKSYAVVLGEKQIRIQVNMPHGHQPGWAPHEIGLFIDSKCRGGKALPIPGDPVIKDAQVEVICKTVTALKSAAMNYTTDAGPRSKRTWHTIPATVNGAVVIAPKPPADANTWFISITDERGAMVTSPVKILP